MSSPNRKKILTSGLQLGMYIDEFCGSWINHPFWKAGFAVEDVATLERIRGSGVREIWIDPARSRFIAAPEPTQAPAPKAAEGPVVSKPAQARAAVDASAEMVRASKIIRESRKAVVRMLDDARMGHACDIGEAAELVNTIVDSIDDHASALIGLVRLKRADEYTFMHSTAVAALMVALSRTLGYDDRTTELAGMAGLLHDIGKAQVPLEILNKPGSLNEVEWTAIRTHPERGHAIIGKSPNVPSEVLDAILHHHEKMDGTGYPHALPQGEIATIARMTAICDVYDAITSNRPYKGGWQPAIAVRRMAEWKGHFDEAIFKAFVKAVGIYPVGSLVRLHSKRLAVVVEHDPEQLLQPLVRVFFSLRSKVHIAPELVRLGAEGSSDRIVGFEDPASQGFTRIDDLWVPPEAQAAA
jgi:putative nucleotidyltransferase with HDIG domain